MSITDARTAEEHTRLATRAVLIFLVVLGHNQIFRNHTYYTGYIWIYSFHVGAFFVLATLSPARRIDLKTIRSLARRIYLPFLIATLGYGCIFFVAGLSDAANPFDWLGDLLRAVTIATAPFLDRATGLKMLWFLPSFAVFCILYNAWGQLRPAWRPAALVILFAVHGLIGTISTAVLELLPFGLGVSLFLLFPALLFAFASPLLCRPTLAPILALAFAVTTALQIDQRLEIILSDFRFPGFAQPGHLVIADCQLILGTALCLAVGRALAPLTMVRTIGRHSMTIYLVHAPLNLVLGKLVQPHLPLLAGIVLTVLLTLAGSLVAAIAIHYAAARFNPGSTRSGHRQFGIGRSGPEG